MRGVTHWWFSLRCSLTSYSRALPLFNPSSQDHTASSSTHLLLYIPTCQQLYIPLTCFRFRPTPMPSVHPMPRSMALPNSSMGISSYTWSRSMYVRAQCRAFGRHSAYMRQECKGQMHSPLPAQANIVRYGLASRGPFSSLCCAACASVGATVCMLCS